MIFTSSEWIEYALKGKVSDAERTDMLRRYLASNHEARGQMTGLRRTFYRVDIQLPRVELDPDFQLEIDSVIGSWQERKGLNKMETRSVSSGNAVLYWLLLIFLIVGIFLWGRS